MLGARGKLAKGATVQQQEPGGPSSSLLPTASKISRMAPGTRPRKAVMKSSQTDQVHRVTRSLTKQLSSTHIYEDSSQGRDEVCTQSPTRCPSSLVERSQQTSHIAMAPSATNDEDQATDVAGQIEEHTTLDDEDTPPSPKRCCRGPRGPSMGKGLDRMSRGMGTKMHISVVEGKRRPEQPLQAAKLASECGISVRQHVPILPHWKEYKKAKHANSIKDYFGKVAGKFDINIQDKATNYACTDMLKSGIRQMRYRLKKRYFDGVPANQVVTKSPVSTMEDDQWRELVQKWSDPKNKETSEKNKENRSRVKLHQRTGSRSYIAHCYSLREKYKDEAPNAIDLFKECHNSKKKGFSDPVKQAIADMEAMRDQPVEDGQEPKSCTTIVSEVLSQISGTSKFLDNVGLQSGTKNKLATAAAAHVQHLKQALQLERHETVMLRQTVQAQQQELDMLKKIAEEAEAARNKHAEEMAEFRKKQEENDAILRRLLSLSQVHATP